MEYINMTIKRQKNIALIAHDGKKQDMILLKRMQIRSHSGHKASQER